MDSNGQIGNRNEVNRDVVGAVHAEVVDLPLIVAASILCSEMMAVTATDCKTDRTLPNPSGLALNAEDLAAIIDGKVISSVFSEGRQDAEAGLAKDKHDGEGRSISDVLWMVHRIHLVRGLGRAVSKTDNKNFAYDGGAPE